MTGRCVPATNVLFLPGMMCDERLFAPQLQALGITAQVADFARHESIADMATHALATAPPEFAVIGLSMGGIVAFEIWRQAPDRVTHLALLDTNAKPDTPEKRSTRLDQISQAIHGGLRELAIESLKPVYLAECNRDDDQLLGTILDMALDLGPDVFRRQSLALRDRCDSVPTLATITCPTAVICGVEDRLCPVEYHELIADEIDNATLTVLGDCGHLVTLEQPAAVTQELQRLLAA